jgi:hypothetical protein
MEKILHANCNTPAEDKIKECQFLYFSFRLTKRNFKQTAVRDSNRQFQRRFAYILSLPWESKF